MLFPKHFSFCFYVPANWFYSKKTSKTFRGTGYRLAHCETKDRLPGLGSSEQFLSNGFESFGHALSQAQPLAWPVTLSAVIARWDPLSYFSFQPVLHDWCNKGCGLGCPVCGMVHIKEPLLLIGKSSPCGRNRFPLSLWMVLYHMFRSSQCSTTGATKAMVCVILSVGWCI